MEIVAIEPIGKKKSRIVFDSYEKIALYNKELGRYQLEVGVHLPECVYEEIRTGILLPRAKRRVLYLLQSMDRTEAQLRQKLREGFFPEDVIDVAIDYGKSFHYIDDKRYARNYADANLSGKSRRMVALELERKGIAKECVLEILEEIPENQERDAIKKLIQKKRLTREEQDEKAIMKVKQFLLRKGFSYEMIDSVMNQHLKEY